ncbi:MAG: sulfite exporter TauE/SafE family protein [Sulfurovum sp.]
MENITIFSLFLIGLSYGSTACMFTCMPFLSPLLLTNSNTLKESMSVMIPFSLGRVFSYITIAIIASYSSIFVKDLINDQELSQIILGTITIGVALFIIRQSFTQTKGCCSTSNSKASTTLSYFIMGSAISFNLCLPVVTLITASAYSNTIFEALLFGLFFGVGAVFASFIIFGFIVSLIAREFVMEFTKYKHIIERVAGGLLLVVGIFTFFGWIRL